MAKQKNPKIRQKANGRTAVWPTTKQIAQNHRFSRSFPKQKKALEAGLLVMDGTHWVSREFNNDSIIKTSKSAMIQIYIRKPF